MSDIQKFIFNDAEVRTVLIKGEPWFVGKDVAELLGYKDTFAALKQHVKEVDKQNWQNTSFQSPRGFTIINESGLYSLIFRSKMEAAEEFTYWVTSEVLPTLRKTGVYKLKQQDKAEKAEFRRKQLEIQDMNARTRLGEAIQKMVLSPKFPLSELACQILAHESATVLVGHELPAMLPDSVDVKLFSAGEIAFKFFGTSKKNRTVMSVARKSGLVPPQPESNEYGRWKLTRSSNGHECDQWFFNEFGRDAVQEKLFEAGLIVDDSQIALELEERL